MAVLQLGDQGYDQVSEIWEYLLRIVGSETTQDLDGLDLNVVIGILHAIEEHQKVLDALRVFLNLVYS